LRDLDISHFFRAILLSEEIGIEKPDRQIFMRTIDLVYASTQRNPAKPSECLHIGDEFYR
jgi:FMN phosphatase YigB (HAD superfamily)